MKSDVTIIKNQLMKLNSFNATPEFGTTRVLFTKEELAAREYMKDEMRAIGMEVYEDGCANIFGVFKGENPELAPVWTGSHIDTVLNAGMFDGMAGVVAGMEAMRQIHQHHGKTLRDIVLVIYTSEEPTRFKSSCLGSRAMAGELTWEQCQVLKDDEGNTLADTLVSLGHNQEEYEQVKKDANDVFAAVELHIEQNNILDRNQKKLGVVKAICAPSTFAVKVHGKQSHAGGTSMAERKDAYMAACEIALKLEEYAITWASEYTTGTVGKVNVVPGAENVIPGLVEFSIDIRDIDFENKERLINKLKDFITELEERRGVKVEIATLNHDHPVVCNEVLRDSLFKSCREIGEEPMELISGAYHDSLLVGRFAPVAMLFVPSKDGISHSPDEWTDFEDIALGADVLANTLLELANLEVLEG